MLHAPTLGARGGRNGQFLPGLCRSFLAASRELGGGWRAGADSACMVTTRFKIAAAATVAALGVLAAVALAAGGVEKPAAGALEAAAPPEEVRTEVVREVVRRTRRGRGR